MNTKSRKITRITSLILALIMSLSLMSTAFAADLDFTVDEDEPDVPLVVSSFKDVKSSDWFYSDVMACAKLGIVAGFEDGTFKPDNSVTSIQFLVMLTRAFYSTELAMAERLLANSGKSYEWYAPYTTVASSKGLSNLLDAADINDTKGMTRYNMANVIYQVLKGQNKLPDNVTTTRALMTIKDQASIPSAYKTGVATCYAAGIITGMDDGSFQGTGTMTRAQACTVINRIIKLIGGSNIGDTDNEVYDDGESQVETTTQLLANGKPATVENVQAILEQIKSEYPTGTIWGDRNTPGTNYYKDGLDRMTDSSRDLCKLNLTMKCGPNAYTSLQYACGGFACMVSERIFGKTGAPAREIYSIADMRPGDIVYTISKSTGYVAHVSIVYKTWQENGVWHYVCCSGNTNSMVVWPSTSAGGSTTLNGAVQTRVFTRYQ